MSDNQKVPTWELPITMNEDGSATVDATPLLEHIKREARREALEWALGVCDKHGIDSVSEIREDIEAELDKLEK